MSTQNGNPEQEENDYAELQIYLKEVSDRNKIKCDLLKENRNVSNRPDEFFFRKLDSSMKKNRAFVRKLKTLNGATCNVMKSEFSGLNLSQYTSEMATALCESKRKMDDVMSAVEICTLINVRYEDFSGHLFESFTKMLLSRKDNKITNPTSYRINLRFFAELVIVGIFPDRGLSFISGQLNIITLMDLETFSNIAILSAFVKFCGLDYAGLHHRNQRITAEKSNIPLPNSTLLNSDKRRSILTSLNNYYELLVNYVGNKHVDLCNLRRQNVHILQTRGELSADRNERFQTQSNYFDNLFESAKTFGNYIDQDMTEFADPNEKNEDTETNGVEIIDDIDIAIINTVWYADDDMRSFYEDVPDLTKLVPIGGGQVTSSKQECKIVSNKPKKVELDTISDSIEIELPPTDGTCDDSKTYLYPIEESTYISDTIEDKVEEEVEPINSGVRLSFNEFMSRLSSSLNREMVDKAAEEFCQNFNTRPNRRKLARAIFNVNRTRYDLLPLYSRLVKSLFIVMQDVGLELVEHLKKDFLWQLKVKNQINIESKLRTVRFIAELTKFRIMPPANCLNCLKVLIHDFSYHNIEMTCAILESCGRFLYCHHETRQRAKVYLEWIIQKKSHLHLDSRYIVMIENAYYSTKPAEMVAHKPVQTLCPKYQYVHHLLHSELNKGNIDKVVTQLCKYNWNMDETFDFMVSCFVEVWRYKYSYIQYAANVIAALVRRHVEYKFHIVVVDRLVEGVKLGLESATNISWKQRRIAAVKMLGELNMYNIVDCDTICNILYSLLSYGVKHHPLINTPSTFEQMKDSLFRIRLVSTLLDSLYKQFIDRAQLVSFYGRKLEYFVIVFRKYFWQKYSDKMWDETNPFPCDIFSIYRDVADCPLLNLAPCNSEEDSNTLFSQLSSNYCAINYSDEPSLDLITYNKSHQQPVEDKLKEIERKRQDAIRMDNDKNDTDFIKAFDKMVSVSSTPRNIDRVKLPVAEISAGLVNSIDNGTCDPNASIVKCRLLTRKGKKHQHLALLVDSETQLGSKFVAQQEESLREDLIMKDVVMKMHERQEKEDQYEIMHGNNSISANINRDRKVRYKHPRGVPDVDASFGTN